MEVITDKHLESYVNELVAKGYHPRLHRDDQEWSCELECSVDILPATQPRPIGHGPSAVEALVDAMRKMT
jgi:hypothetical protein